jgi:nitrate reductase beta subunit
MKYLIILMLLISFAAEAGKVRDSAPTVRDEELSQKYEALVLDGEDAEVVRDLMTSDGVMEEDLEIMMEAK